MTDSPSERHSNSKSNLIDVQHVGVTAKLQSPLKNLLLNYSSSTETDNNQILYRGSQHSNAKYNKFTNEAVMETDATVTDNSKVLYELKTLQNKRTQKSKSTPSKIEFQLYTRSKRLRKSKSAQTQKNKSQRNLFNRLPKSDPNVPVKKSSSLFQRLRQSFHDLKNSNTNATLLDDLPEPGVNMFNGEVRIGIYPFDHGCAEYLKTHECPPQIVSLAIAKRATDYATKFWAEFFGSIHIGVAFVVTFILQSYRFILYSLVNTLLVGFLHMTSDYLIKPMLTVIFNGFLQPPLIFGYNILASLRDILEPIADTMNNFMKPVATVGKSVRLIHATYNKKNVAGTA